MAKETYTDMLNMQASIRKRKLHSVFSLDSTKWHVSSRLDYASTRQDFLHDILASRRPRATKKNSHPILKS
jgi:hypothetical protein